MLQGREPEDGPAGGLNAIRQVLVVDDSRLQRRILASSLKKWGFEVIEAESGEAAMEICSGNLPDLVLSDWVMPGMSGVEFCEAFRAINADRYCYFILLTLQERKKRSGPWFGRGSGRLSDQTRQFG